MRGGRDPDALGCGSPFGASRRLGGDADARGELVSDAVIAALAIEADTTVISYDRDFARFDGLSWRTPAA